MKRIGLSLFAAIVPALVFAITASAQVGPQFQQGFKHLADQIPDVVGLPVEQEQYTPDGDASQQTTAGVMVYRKSDGWTAFTSEALTWIDGPAGLQERTNGERLPWESDYARLFVLSMQDLPTGFASGESWEGVVSNQDEVRSRGDPDNASRQLAMWRRVSGYESEFNNSSPTAGVGPMTVDSAASVYETAEGAHEAFDDWAKNFPSTRQMPVHSSWIPQPVEWAPAYVDGVGDASVAFQSVLTVRIQDEDYQWILHLVGFRRATFLGFVFVAATPETADFPQSVRFALLMDSRMVGRVAYVSVAPVQPRPELQAGFAALAAQIADVVGQPVEDEHYSQNGDALQQTTTGLMVWRKADNWTAFTNGTRTWMNGPFGIQVRANEDRFDWETAPSALAPVPIPSDTPPSAPFEPTATRVIDGYTIEVEIPGQGTAIVRYIGVGTPDLVDPRLTTEHVAEIATAKNRELVEGKTVFLEGDVSETDEYGQLMRYVYLADGTFVNQELLRQGFAQAVANPPDVQYQELFLSAEREARDAYRGFWGPLEVYGPIMEQVPLVIPTLVVPPETP
jgi:endonuclease YncB( thermonuclease family)